MGNGNRGSPIRAEIGIGEILTTDFTERHRFKTGLDVVRLARLVAVCTLFQWWRLPEQKAHNSPVQSISGNLCNLWLISFRLISSQLVDDSLHCRPRVR